ncbi:Methyltransferase domain-containing protein [Haloechinothrix alba]|uniref:Arsenite methyltransferase n=1 Tax=Haloechinothrix alba TaxID=664784 RepID=A0A238V3J1_9PSEU|nr:methyltransferase domain-containing protein [Haloechinothrix alba]SNR28741.1 Methyltransferase domain-containing protein [Haloechinothrix alba]
MTSTVNTHELETKVKEMYRLVAEEPHGTYHFETGRRLAEHLGYEPALLDRIPAESIDSFAGVGHFLDLADIRPGQRVIDLGSGSGMDSFLAAELTGTDGMVLGVDFTPQQLTKARRLATAAGIDHVQFRHERIERLPAKDASVDRIISNGVINLCPDKAAVFAESARVLRPGGKLAIADIVSEQQLTEAIVGNADLWASCIGGAAQQDTYRNAIESAGLRVEVQRRKPYRFLTDSARNATETFGVKSISLVAVKPGE